MQSFYDFGHLSKNQGFDFKNLLCQILNLFKYSKYM